MIFFRPVVVLEIQKPCFYNQTRFLPRWSSREPKKVHFPEKMELENNQTPPKPIENKLNYLTSFSFKAKKNNYNQEVLTVRKVKKKAEAKSTIDMLETIIDADGNLIYTKMKNNDSRIATILSDLKSEKRTKTNKSFFIEGKRIIREALRSNCKLEYILFSRKSDLEGLKLDLPRTGAKIYKMPYSEMQLWSSLTTNPGIMGIFKIPEFQPVPFNLPVNVICDNIREPGNLGTMLRICAGIGTKTVILTKGCCDIWNSKVLRGGMGAHFKLNIEKLDWEEIKTKFKTTHFFIGDNNTVKTIGRGTSIIDFVDKIPMESYDNIKYSAKNEISLIIGGETEGISEEAYTLVEALGGMRLNIPLINKIDSLNCSTALGVLLFEMRRQLKKEG